MVRRIAAGVCTLAIIAIVAMLMDPANRIKVMGWVQGETFYRDMPRSYWLAALESLNDILRHEAILAAGRDKAAIPGLIRRLQDEVPQLRCMAAVELARFGADARDAVPALTAMLKDEDRSCRQAARDALQKIDPTALEPAKTR